MRARQRLAEMEYTYPLRRFSVQALQSLLTEPGFGLPPAFAEAANTPNFETVHGFMKGFLDLVFQADGKYYLLD